MNGFEHPVARGLSLATFSLGSEIVTRAIDCDYAGYDECTRKYHVHEQLYPENRGFIVHEFDSEEEALEWIRNLSPPDPRSSRG